MTNLLEPGPPRHLKEWWKSEKKPRRTSFSLMMIGGDHEDSCEEMRKQLCTTRPARPDPPGAVVTPKTILKVESSFLRTSLTDLSCRRERKDGKKFAPKYRSDYILKILAKPRIITSPAQFCVHTNTRHQPSGRIYRSSSIVTEASIHVSAPHLKKHTLPKEKDRYCECQHLI